MPANLPPHYFEAEQRFREARTPAAKIEALEEMLAIMPKHKGTDKLKAMLRERISKLKEQGQKKSGGAKAKTPYSIEREGIAQVVLTGMPNTGKSSLLNRLTKATAEVGDFPHTTHRPTPGMAPTKTSRSSSSTRRRSPPNTPTRSWGTCSAGATSSSSSWISRRTR